MKLSLNLPKGAEKFLAACALAAALAAVWGAQQEWQQLKQIHTQRLQVQQKLLVQQRFANEHADYAAFARGQQQKLQDLQKQAQQKLDLDNRLQHLQTQAQAQGLMLLGLSLAEKTPGKGALSQQAVKISLSGDFFALLRWLRQAERDSGSVRQLRLMAADASGTKLYMELILELQHANLK